MLCQGLHSYTLSHANLGILQLFLVQKYTMEEETSTNKFAQEPGTYA